MDNNMMSPAPKSGKTAVIAGIICLIVGLAAGYGIAKMHRNTTAATSNGTGDQMQMSAGQSSAAQDLHTAMRKLWSDHVIWTREYIVAAVEGTPDAQAAATRLMANQDDIGNAIIPYYGADAGHQLTALLKQHISIAVDLVAAAKAGNNAKFNQEAQAWNDNGKQIADFLAAANPNWPKDQMEEMMQTHLDTTTREAKDRLTKNYTDDVQAFDAVYNHILKMSDMLSDGIVKQFPSKF